MQNNTNAKYENNFFCSVWITLIIWLYFYEPPQAVRRVEYEWLNNLHSSFLLLLIDKVCFLSRWPNNSTKPGVESCDSVFGASYKTKPFRKQALSLSLHHTHAEHMQEEVTEDTEGLSSLNNSFLWVGGVCLRQTTQWERYTV